MHRHHVMLQRDRGRKRLHGLTRDLDSLERDPRARELMRQELGELMRSDEPLLRQQLTEPSPVGLLESQHLVERLLRE